ncbi:MULTISPECIES: neutral zinc metallopeptidase [unclassified Kribbella]|uniref:neutral zinc metallopeptidase n=1 Tax=unclassified Kribbella TaxID=2644121 RepID=UPI0030772746
MNTRGLAATCAAAVLLLAGCTSTAEPAADEAAASEAEKLRSALPTTTPTPEPSAPVSAPPQPAALAKNPIYRVGKLAASQCEEPTAPATSLANVREYYTQYVACLNDVWAPAIRKAGFTFVAPKLVVVLGKSPSSPCDFDDGQAYYCGDTIYMDAKVDITTYKEDPDWARAWMALLIGHEYGHHVQALTGILEAKYKRGLQLNGVDLQLEENRRLELQASCFSAAYLGADRDYFPADDGWREVWDEVIAASEDPAGDHGSAANHAHWTDAGFEAGGPGACNTYNADASFVG